jgi:hypothetical protein
MTDAARTLASHLLARHADLKSWRAVAGEYDNPLIKFGTLQRIARSGGEWLPKDRRILRALGLLGKRSEVQKRIDSMARTTVNSVVRRKPTKKMYVAVKGNKNVDLS